MSGRTKKPPIKARAVTMRFVVQAKCAALVRRAVAPYLAPTGDTVPAEEFFSNKGPGDLVRGARYREGLTQAQLAQKVGVPQRHISEMENGKRPIGKAMAQRLGLALGVGYKMFL